MTIINNFAFPVISDDRRDPYVSFQNHKDRGSLGGVDLAYPYGTPIAAPSDGKGYGVEWNGSGGHTYKLVTDQGTIEFMHLSRFGKIGDIKTGDIIGWSGGSGNGKPRFYDPHLHVHIVVNGTRLNLWDYFTKGNQMNTLELVKVAGDDRIYFSVNRIQRRHVPNPQTLKDYQAWMDVLKQTNPNVKPDVQTVLNLEAFGTLV